MAAHLAQLRLTEFKGFADPATLDILPGFTGLVGPNGCGKGNLAEDVVRLMVEVPPRAYG